MSAAMAPVTVADELIKFGGSDVKFRELCSSGFTTEIQKNNTCSIERAFSVLGAQAHASPRSVEKVIMMLEELQKLTPDPRFVLGLSGGIMTAQSYFSKNGKEAGLKAITQFLDSFKSPSE